MFSANRPVVALAVGLSAAFASQALAQPAQPAPSRAVPAGAPISKQRAAAIEKCMKDALTQYPDTTYDNDGFRSQVYAACMNAAEEAP
jgi:hypothetical protein